MNLVINAVSAKRGGAVTYLQNVLPELRRQLGGGNHNITVWRAFGSGESAAWPEGFDYREDRGATGGEGAIGGTAGRIWFDQARLPRMLKSLKADALFSSANFGPLRCPCRQVLLVRNPLYFDRNLLARIASRKARAYYLVQRRLTLLCMQAADAVLFPTTGMRDMVSDWTGGPRPHWRVAQYGAPLHLFAPARPAASGGGETASAGGRVRLLYVSIYGEHKNFRTLFGAVEALESAAPGRFHVSVTGGFQRQWMTSTPFFPNFEAERGQFESLASRGAASDVDWRQYGSLPDLYRAADIFVFPSYSESFGHPLVEAMASGLPVVAADIPVSRELCGDAALYYSPFDPGACAGAIRRVADDAALRDTLRANGLRRAADFTWSRHVATLLDALRGGAGTAGSTGELHA